ncbi:MAG: hypothetical protein IIT76_00955, partial [Prevotella sp.]|nr:hypothetical protein [Prevotella sp.]
MKKKMFLAFMAFAALAIVGCSNDDNETEQPDVPERQDVTGFDDLEYFQEYFVNVDSLGNFVSRSIGIPLPVYDTDTTHIFIGVEDIEEALTYWADCLPPIDEIRPLLSGNYPYIYTLTDKEGRSQGTVSFAPNTEPGFVADITTNLPGLRHFKKVTFVQNGSWPVDFTEGQYHFGDVRTFTVSYRDDEASMNQGREITKTRTMKFVCLREKSRGVKPLYVSITPDLIDPNDDDFTLLVSDYCPKKRDALMIYRILYNYRFSYAMELFA